MSQEADDTVVEPLLLKEKEGENTNKCAKSIFTKSIAKTEEPQDCLNGNDVMVAVEVKANGDFYDTRKTELTAKPEPVIVESENMITFSSPSIKKNAVKANYSDGIRKSNYVVKENLKYPLSNEPKLSTDKIINKSDDIINQLKDIRNVPAETPSRESNPLIFTTAKIHTGTSNAETSGATQDIQAKTKSTVFATRTNSTENSKITSPILTIQSTANTIKNEYTNDSRNSTSKLMSTREKTRQPSQLTRSVDIMKSPDILSQKPLDVSGKSPTIESVTKSSTGTKLYPENQYFTESTYSNNSTKDKDVTADSTQILKLSENEKTVNSSTTTAPNNTATKIPKSQLEYKSSVTLETKLEDKTKADKQPTIKSFSTEKDIRSSKETEQNKTFADIISSCDDKPTLKSNDKIGDNKNYKLENTKLSEVINNKTVDKSHAAKLSAVSNSTTQGSKKATATTTIDNVCDTISKPSTVTINNAKPTSTVVENNKSKSIQSTSKANTSRMHSISKISFDNDSKERTGTKLGNTATSPSDENKCKQISPDVKPSQSKKKTDK